MQHNVCMTLNQIGILIQIAGFVIVGVLAQILLERQVVGRFADKVEAFFSILVVSIDKFFPTKILGVLLGDEVKEDDEKKLYAISLRRLSITLLIVIAVYSIVVGGIISIIMGKLEEIPWLLYAGVGITSFIILAYLYFHVVFLTSLHRELGCIFILLTAISGIASVILLLAFFTIAAPLYIIVCLFAIFMRLLQLMGLYLARNAMLRRISIIGGTLIILSGLILQFIYATSSNS